MTTLRRLTPPDRLVARSVGGLLALLALSACQEPSKGAALGRASSADLSALDARYVEAARQLEAGRDDQAERLCADVASVPECHRLLGVLARKRQQTPQACAHFDAYLKLPQARDVAEVSRARDALSCP